MKALLAVLFISSVASAAPSSDFLDKNIQTALACVNQLEPHDTYTYPYTPKEFQRRHPAFFGCFDWHASVFNHAALLRILNKYPNHPLANQIKAVMADHFSPANIAVELLNSEADIKVKLYEPAWFLRLTLELREATYPEAEQWLQDLKPLEELSLKIFSKFLREIRYADQNMMHENTAYSLAHAWDYAVAVNNTALSAQIKERAMYFYSGHKNCDAANEIDDSHGIVGFVSPCFAEVDLMRRILSASDFQIWLSGFFPVVPDTFLAPVPPRGRYPYYQTGLMLQKATAMRGLARSVSDSVLAERLRTAADVQSSTAEPVMFDYGYIGEHWLPAFYIYSLE